MGRAGNDVYKRGWGMEDGGGGGGWLRGTIFRLNTTLLHLLSSVTVDHNQFTTFKIPRFNPFDSSF